jgi:hypothetical protein
MNEYQLQIKLTIIALPRRSGEINLEQVQGELEQIILSYVNTEVQEIKIDEIAQVVGR